MEGLLDNKRKKLFDEAYQAYMKITKHIEEMYSEGMVDPFSERPSVTDMVCSLDKYLQGCLLQIAVSDGKITEDELHFILELPDEFDEVCARNRGYKRFIRTVTVDSFSNEANKFFDFNKKPEFLVILCEDYSEAPAMVRSNLQVIFNAFIAIDGIFSESEADTALKILDKVADEKEVIASSKEETPVQTESSDKKESTEIDSKAVEGEEIEAVLDELNGLVGLAGVKQEVITSINLLRINNMRKAKGLPELQTSNHMVFTGNPGTGKTTVARIMAKIYKCLGVVSKGQLVETDRAGLVAGYVGQTALKTAAVIKKAKGGVLFIDEAYSLSSEDGSNDYGKEAIDTLVKGMEDYRDDLVVIVAGYVNEMRKFINMNPGLRSRFNKYIHFENYSADEMLEILKRLCEKSKFIMTKESEDMALEFFQKNQSDPTFGNGRGVRNFFDKIVMSQATRIISIKNPTETDFRTIRKEDVAQQLIYHD